MQQGTWGAFKSSVEAAGVKDDDVLGYIDIREYREEYDPKWPYDVDRYPDFVHSDRWRFSVR